MSEWINTFFSERIEVFLYEKNMLEQFLIVLIVFIFPYIVKKIAQKKYRKLEPEIRFVWLKNIISILLPCIQSLGGYLILWTSLSIMLSLGLKHRLLDELGDFLLIWLFFQFIQRLFFLNLREGLARFLSRRVLLPIVFIVAILSYFDLLEDVVTWKLTFHNLDFSISLQSILVGSFILFLFIVSGKAIRHFLVRNALPEIGAAPSVSQAVSTLAFYVVVFVGLLISFTTIGINLSSLNVILGGLSVGIGFGLQSIISNFISGFILMFEKSVGPGDIIEMSGVRGKVKHIGIRSITLLTRDNIELVIPNSYYLTEMVTNLTRSSEEVRLRISVGVSYDEAPKVVEKALLESAEHELVLKTPKPVVQFTDFGDSSLNFDLLVWTHKAEYIAIIASELRFRVFEVFKKYGISIPFPQRDIHIKTNTTKNSFGNK